MRRKRARVPRAHGLTAANAPLRPSALRATIAPRVQRPVVDPPMGTVQPVQRAPTVSVPPPVSVPRARSMTVPLPQSDPLVVSANVPPMATVRHAVNGLTASAHRAPVVLIPIALVQTALGRTGQLLIAHPRTAEGVMSVPRVSDPVARHARSMTAPATPSDLRAR